MTGNPTVAGAGVAAGVRHGEMGESRVSGWLFNRTESSWIWLILRLYLGYEWFTAALGDKLESPAWRSGASLTGFVHGALAKTGGSNPSVQGWYASFLRSVILPHVAFWAWVVAFGELLVGLALILGLFTGIAAFFGGFMNFNYLMAGSVSVNPFLFVIATWVVLAWKVAGWYGLDRWVLPALGTPWRPGRASHPAS